MGQKKHKIIPIHWTCPVFPLANFTLALVVTNIENCDMQFVTPSFLLRHYEKTQYRLYKVCPY